MYCQACGSEVQEGLRFCNRCGANLSGETENVAPPRLFGLLMVIAVACLLVGVIGLAAIFFFAIELMGRGSVPAEVVAFLIVFTLVFFGVEALLIRQLSRTLGVYLKTGGTNETRPLNQTKKDKQLAEARQEFVQTESLHKTASDQSEQPTRILPEDAPTTRKLEMDEK
jgi:hypothetical protein